MDLPGHDICRLRKSIAGWQLSGTAIFLFEQMPCLLAYEVSVDGNWQTCVASVSGFVGQSAVMLAIAPTPNGHWNVNGVESQEAVGCIDLDLGFTPATNLIAIRRLNLKVDEQSLAPAAWLDFPDFKLKQIDGEEFEVGSGDFMGFPTPSVAHHLKNVGDEDLVYLTGGENLDVEIAEFPRLEKRMLRRGNSIEVYDFSDAKPFRKLDP